MTQFDFAGVRIGLLRNQDIPDIAFPTGFRPIEATESPDIRIELSVGNASLPEPEGEARLKRGRMLAFGDEHHLFWWHPDLGTIIDIFPREGRIHIALPASAWLQTLDIFNHLFLPGLLPPLAARGVRALHASAIDMHGKSVIVAGHSGSGKTTSALMMLSQGARLVSDDLLFLYRDESGYCCSGLGDGLRARDDVWSRFKHLNPGKTDVSGKRHLGNDSILWVRRSHPIAVLLIGFDNLDGKLRDFQSLPALLSLTYHAGDEKQALTGLQSFIESMDIQGVAGSEKAAMLALNLLRGL